MLQVVLYSCCWTCILDLNVDLKNAINPFIHVLKVSTNYNFTSDNVTLRHTTCDEKCPSLCSNRWKYSKNGTGFLEDRSINVSCGKYYKYEKLEMFFWYDRNCINIVLMLLIFQPQLIQPMLSFLTLLVSHLSCLSAPIKDVIQAIT